MKLLWAERGWEDYLWWQANDADMLRRLNALLRDIGRDPFRGIGKPEPLRNELRGWWSRRINAEHRIVYRIAGPDDARHAEIMQCRWHYDR